MGTCLELHLKNERKTKLRQLRVNTTVIKWWDTGMRHGGCKLFVSHKRQVSGAHDNLSLERSHKYIYSCTFPVAIALQQDISAILISLFACVIFRHKILYFLIILFLRGYLYGKYINWTPLRIYWTFSWLLYIHIYIYIFFFVTEYEFSHQIMNFFAQE